MTAGVGTAPPAAVAGAPIPSHPDLPATPPAGLTDDEAARRRGAGLGNTSPPATTRTYRQIVVENLFTFINNILFVLAVGLVLVGRPMDALVSLGGHRDQRDRRHRPGGPREADPRPDRAAHQAHGERHPRRRGARRGQEELVVGDLIEIAPGDQVVLDGRLASGAPRGWTSRC